MKLLYITSDLDAGGIEKLLFEYTKRITKNFEIDFAISSNKKGMLEDDLKKCGCNIFRIGGITKDLRKRDKALYNILKKNKYDIVHDNSGYKAYFSLRIARKTGVKVRIAHAHTSNVPESFIHRIVRYIFTFLTKTQATSLFACGEQAAKWMWGKRDFEKNKVYIMKNSICMEKYKYNVETRANYRSIFKVEDNIVIGCVARFSYEKNHDFLIDVFKKIILKNDKYRLILVGTGELEATITEKIKEMNLQNYVILTGIRKDVSDIYNSFDCFILPSFYEGLPVTYVEAQANGLSIVCSSNVTKEIAINPNIHYLSLNENSDNWADYIINLDKNRCFVDKEKFPLNIENTSSDLENHYKLLVENCNMR